MLTILGRRTSGNVMLPLWAADELGLDYEQVDIGGAFGGNDRPDYLARNPNGLVPTIDDDGFVLWESGAITRYLCAKYGLGSLCPSDSQERAVAEQWMDWKLTTVMPMMSPIFMGLVRTPEAERDLHRIERAIQLGHGVWSILDQRLASRDFICGEALTMADIPLGPQVHRWYELVDDPPDLPNLAAWYERLRQRPAFQRNCMIPIV